MRAIVVLACLFWAASAFAQKPIEPIADWVSYGTFAVNPTIAAVHALQSPNRRCAFERLALSEAIGNGVSLTLKHFIVSPRPCLGCVPDGMPSGHTMNSAIGFSTNWQVGLAFTLGTAELRVAAHRHTPWQVLAGAAIGIGAESAGHLLRCS
jgi:membrane-associated phospholipid phosphatase